MNYIDFDGVGLAELVKQKQVSPEELIEASFKRMEEINPEINAVIRTRKEKAVKEARDIDFSQPFAGVPIVLKDISQAIQGEKLTAGARLMRNFTAKQDSHLVARLRKAGFLFIGQTNTPEFGLKNITEPEIHGQTKNPWNTDHSAGGSSGGSAASIAAGIVPIAGASDGGGSIRIPASFTGLFGLKPTRGRTPVGPGTGRQWQGASIDFALTRSVRDSAALLDVLQTFQPSAAFHIPKFEVSYLKELENPKLPKFRVAFTTESPVGTPVSEAAKKAVHKVAGSLVEQGHHVEERSNGVDGMRLMKNYYLMNCGEMSSVISNFEQGLGREITSHDVEIVTWVLYKAGEKVSAAEFAKSLAEWDLAAAQMDEFHQTYDLYLTPTNAFPAPLNGELTHSHSEREELLEVGNLNKQEQQQLVYDMFEPSLTYTPFTQLANLTGQPAMNVPVHLAEKNLPMGVQFTAPKGKEDWLLSLASHMEQSGLWLDITKAATNQKPR
ncbi:amidase [Sediminibacillus massiliensis]|uniref:amidase n=1 Tax=Sediminibacillus massiliensis TaxID=1926277 RepID=UPI0009883D3D|nr:amidase [Sediminibacillus massiliensis]